MIIWELDRFEDEIAVFLSSVYPSFWHCAFGNLPLVTSMKPFPSFM
jgi:hypothetical protein